MEDNQHSFQSRCEGGSCDDNKALGGGEKMVDDVRLFTGYSVRVAGLWLWLWLLGAVDWVEDIGRKHSRPQ